MLTRTRTQFYTHDGKPYTPSETSTTNETVPPIEKKWRQGGRGYGIYNPKFAKAAYNLLARHGFTWKELANIFGISEPTLFLWKRKYPDFSQALKNGRDDYDLGVVEAALLKSVCGYSHPEDKIFCNSRGEITIVPTVKHYPPSVLACIYWTKNRAPERWRDIKAVDLQTNKVADRLEELAKVIRSGPKELNKVMEEIVEEPLEDEDNSCS